MRRSFLTPSIINSINSIDSIDSGHAVLMYDTESVGGAVKTKDWEDYYDKGCRTCRVIRE